MKLAYLIVAPVMLLSSDVCRGSVVIHDGSVAVVATGSGNCLDRNGHVWYGSHVEGWVREPEADVPIPVSEIRFWEEDYFVTMSEELWVLSDASWYNLGPWPGTTAVPESECRRSNALTVAPNPATTRIQLTFRLPEEGPASVTLFDVHGRAVRRLLNGPHPPGTYELIWDGRDDSGNLLPGGVFLARIVTAAGAAQEKVVFAR